ncbi:MAG: methylated-DNA--[protein]-cysteine S-methyltransferase [Acinetobacter sp.]|jgi:AraC family transcriptional regulator of adaptative response/methylated-DNA-[protein]-cysteine methyltransferase|nr:methylated-DNA--[protein]-cysteine S-methyltransferase [Acinetobacter sp.]HQV25496.1 methylated-DNA--[protein]-cysteine S-methyltransferase [Acinetobacter sp.]HQW52702.1 methylated-DNA--[protein]-cysteine S-methyltransferase [Acinetobacter sp.]HQZ59772.1 methylated-DNA--[protein]-cysteine S-methyltransferase [Acinetobacter sp.]
MSSQQHYQRIAQAIAYIQQNFQQQPQLDEVAAHIHLSPAHFQRLFSEWVGTSPKKFLQYISVEHAKQILKQQGSIFDATFETGLSSTSRLHDLFIQIEGMTPAEYKNGGESLSIHYQFEDTLFGEVLIASTQKGICALTFVDDQADALNKLISQFPQAVFIEQSDVFQHSALAILQHHPNQLAQIKLHLKGTDFQLKVWQSLLKIPMGQLSTYGQLAKAIDHAKAARAVGTAIGSNPVAFLIPCHRVIQATGALGGYEWGSVRKTAMIGWEGVHSHATV